MRTLGRFTLLQRTEVGAHTETWFATGPGEGGVHQPVRLSRILPTLREEPWLGSQVKRVQAAAGLRAPWVKTHFIGVEAGEPIHVQALKRGVRIGELVRGGVVTPPTAVRCALTLTEALVQAQGLDGAELAIGEHGVTVGWDGALQVGGPDLDLMPPPVPQPNEGVSRVVALLGTLLRGSEDRMTRMARPPSLRTIPPLDGPLKPLFDRYRQGQPHATAGELRDALRAHAGGEAEAARELGGRACTGFVVERAIEVARFGLDPAARLEPLPDDHVGKVNAGLDTEGDWLVLGDWLQAQAHPRGRLIALQMQGLTAEAEQLVEATPELRVPLGGMDALLTWRWGYVDTAEVMSVDGVEHLRLMLSHPSTRFLQQLAVFAGDATTLVRAAESVRPPPTLKTLLGPKLRADDVARLQKAWPQLQRVANAEKTKARGTHLFLGTQE